MTMLDLPIRPSSAKAAPEPAQGPGPVRLFPRDEVAWLAVEAAARLRAAGRPVGTVGIEENSPLASLARDPRLVDLASSLAGTRQRPAALETGRARMLRRLGRVTLFVELGGSPGGDPGLVHARLDELAGDALVVAIGFDRAAEEAAPAGRRQPAIGPEGLWPPAAVVAG
ncbi:hypothetical protein [Geminicoccus roseus]|uniref:hypothetical protein n=1 Tax=Geminicoccus roseus TaxID=404900 RepID=UPI0003F55B06|nr:hypothetical protein [Geminicoccus roseus]